MTTERPAGSAQRVVPMLTEVLTLGPGSGTEAGLVPSSSPASDVALPVLLVRAEEPANGEAVGALVPAQMAEVVVPESVVDASAGSAALPLPPDAGVVQGALLTERVLGDVQRRIDLMLEYRLRETLTPALARMTDNFIRDTRNEIAALLRDVIARSVAAEMDRERAARRAD